MGWLSDLLTGIPALPVARERIALAESKVEAIEAENAKLRVENAHLHERLAAAERLILKPDFVEARGVLFKRKADGSFEPDGYCPDCKRALSRNETRTRWVCTKCNFAAPFGWRDLPAIVASLPKAPE